MKKISILLSSIFIGGSIYAQQPPTDTDPSGNAAGITNQRFWSRGGNNDFIGTNNIFGTLFNSPIYTQTNGITRMSLFGGATGIGDGRLL